MLTVVTLLYLFWARTSTKPLSFIHSYLEAEDESNKKLVKRVIDALAKEGNAEDCSEIDKAINPIEKHRDYSFLRGGNRRKMLNLSNYEDTAESNLESILGYFFVSHSHFFLLNKFRDISEIKEYRFMSEPHPRLNGQPSFLKAETSFEWNSVVEAEKEIVDFDEKDLLLGLVE